MRALGGSYKSPIFFSGSNQSGMSELNKSLNLWTSNSNQTSWQKPGRSQQTAARFSLLLHAAALRSPAGHWRSCSGSVVCIFRFYHRMVGKMVPQSSSGWDFFYGIFDGIWYDMIYLANWINWKLGVSVNGTYLQMAPVIGKMMINW